jgi:hypothetical protein
LIDQAAMDSFLNEYKTETSVQTPSVTTTA